MVTLKKDKQSIQEELSELLNQYYDGSFARMVSEYIRTTGMTEEEVEALLEEMKHSITFELAQNPNPCIINRFIFYNKRTSFLH